MQVWRKVMAAYRRVDGLVICGLTACTPGSAFCWLIALPVTQFRVSKHWTKVKSLTQPMPNHFFTLYNRCRNLLLSLHSACQRCYRRLLKIKWPGKISMKNYLRWLKEDKMCLYKSIQKQKMAFYWSCFIRRQIGSAYSRRKTETDVAGWHKRRDTADTCRY